MRLDPPERPGSGVGPRPSDRAAWQRADADARPRRLDRLRASLAEAGLDAYLGLRPENARYLTGFVLGDGEEKAAGASGRFLVSADEIVVTADSRYRLQAVEECPSSRVAELTESFAESWPALVASLRPISGAGAKGRSRAGGRVRRVGVEAGHLSYADWQALAAAAPEVELVPASGLIEAQRQAKEPSELERIEAACAVADAALAALLAEIRPGVRERDLAFALEWHMRTGGADGLAFDVACLSGPRAALPHGSPGEREVRAGEVLLFDFGARVDGYRSDMTRTLYVGEPSRDDLRLYAVVTEAQSAAIGLLREAVAEERELTNRDVDGAARDVIERAGHGAHFGHGTGHGIGLAIHELPSLGRMAPETALPSLTVFSVEPGIYLDGRSGVRIEDLVVLDRGRRSVDLITGFPRDLTVIEP